MTIYTYSKNTKMPLLEIETLQEAVPGTGALVRSECYLKACFCIFDMKLLILISITITVSARTRPIGGLDRPSSNDVNEISTSNVELPPDFAEKLLMEINRIRICHNAISTGPVVNDACFDDDFQNVRNHVRRSGHRTKKSKKNGKQNKLKNRRSKQKRSERRRNRNLNNRDE